jgi:Raf kinase inhibitor-like YbhB/YbcL family protein
MPDPGFSLRSPAFSNGENIPVTFTCDGRDVSPPLEWMNSPAGTRSYALVVDDPDAPEGTFTHWTLFDIPGQARGLPEGAPEMGVAGRNDFEEQGYGGPCPPPRHGDHRYHFRLHALDVDSLRLDEGQPREAIERAMEGHVLGTAELMGRFSR